jgi:hypothetical protein
MSFLLVTVADRRFMASADAMFASIHEQHPDARGFLLLVDRWPTDTPRPAAYDLLTVEEAGIPDLHRRLFRYTPFERVMSMKSQALLQAWRRYPDFDRILFMDSDVEAVGSLQPLLDLLDGHDIVVTPHLSDWRSEAADFRLMGHAGAFNAGVFGVRRPDGSDFLGWYEKRCVRDCRIDVAMGMVCEQGWLGLVPALFDRVGIDRHPGSNIAYWNLVDRPLTAGPQGLLAAGQPAQSFHFSGWDHRSPRRLSRFCPASEPVSDSPLGTLLSRHLRRLQSSPYWNWRDEVSVFSRFDDGRPVGEWLNVVYSDLLEPTLPADHNPYAGVPWSPDLAAARALWGLAGLLGLGSNGLRQFLGYRWYQQSRRKS